MGKLLFSGYAKWRPYFQEYLSTFSSPSQERWKYSVMTYNRDSHDFRVLVNLKVYCFCEFVFCYKSKNITPNWNIALQSKYLSHVLFHKYLTPSSPTRHLQPTFPLLLTQTGHKSCNQLQMSDNSSRPLNCLHFNRPQCQIPPRFVLILWQLLSINDTKLSLTKPSHKTYV